MGEGTPRQAANLHLICVGAFGGVSPAISQQVFIGEHVTPLRLALLTHSSLVGGWAVRPSFEIDLDMKSFGTSGHLLCMQ